MAKDSMETGCIVCADGSWNGCLGGTFYLGVIMKDTLLAIFAFIISFTMFCVFMKYIGVPLTEWVYK